MNSTWFWKWIATGLAGILLGAAPMVLRPAPVDEAKVRQMILTESPYAKDQESIKGLIDDMKTFTRDYYDDRDKTSRELGEIKAKLEIILREK